MKPPFTQPPLDHHLVMILERSHAGECSAEEREELARWIGDDPARAAEVQRYQRLLEQMVATSDRSADPLAVLRQINQRIDAVEARATRALRPGRNPSSPWWRSAAGVLVASIVAAVLFATGRHVGTRTQVFRTAAGEKATLTLRDGTRVVLGPGTQLRIPADFERSNRTVQLYGEALFAVVHDTKHPFAVRTSHALVRDVGTQFVVRDFAEDSADFVGVQEGAVALRSCSSAGATTCISGSIAKNLRPGDLGFVKGDAVTVQHAGNLLRFTSWLQNGLSFDNTPMQQVVQEIKRTFGVDVTVADSTLLKRHVTATFSGQPVTVVLDIITQTLGARYERTERGFVIRTGTAKARTPEHRVVPPPLVTASAIEPQE